MAKQTFTTGSVLTATQMNNLQANDYNQTVSQKTASYVLVAADKGTRIEMNAAGATTVTVNTGLFNAGDTLFIQNIGAGACTVTAGTATVNKATAGSLTLAQYQGGTLYFVSDSSAIFFADAGYNPPLTTKGDIFTYSTENTRLPIGTNGFVLQADSTATTGNKWTAAGRYLLASGSLSSNNLDLQNISQNYLHLELILRNYYGSADQGITGTVNNDTAANQYGSSSNAVGNFTYNGASFTAVLSYDNTNQNNFAMLTFADYTGSTQKAIFALFNSTDNTNSQRYGGFYQTMIYKGTTAISRITLNTSTGTWSGGTYELYGVK
jgi:hypothetical protein